MRRRTMSIGMPIVVYVKRRISQHPEQEVMEVRQASSLRRSPDSEDRMNKDLPGNPLL